MSPPQQKSYKWIALSNTTLGVFMAVLTGSVTIISLPAIFRGINLDPLQPSNASFLLWTLMGYLVCTSVLVVSFGRLGDLFGRVRMYNLGFLIFTVASIALGFTPGRGPTAAIYLISMRMVQGIGGALLMANSAAILTDAFPPNQRGLAMGINTIAALAGGFIGLIVGGLLADLHWRLVFWVNVPFGIFGTIWAYAKMRDQGKRRETRIDWWGNATFAVGLVLILVGITYGIQPYGHRLMGWTSPSVILELLAGLILLIAFMVIETKVEAPMFDLALFKIRAFSAGNIANFLSAIGRGGLQFMLIIWLQGIWLPLHGYSFERTPFWAGIYMLPLTAGFVLVGPLSGYLSDRHGARYFATGGMILGAIGFALLMTLPSNFSYWAFAPLLFINGLGNGFFAAPNTTAVMNSVPAEKRGQASGMRATGMNVGQVLSTGVYFSLMIIGLASTLPAAMSSRLIAQGVPAPVAGRIAGAPPVASLFAAFLGFNPMAKLLPASVLAALPLTNAANITGKSFFPNLISAPFVHGLRIALTVSVILFLLSAVASWMRGGKYIHVDDETLMAEAEALQETIP